MGEPSGTLFVYYPHGEQMYWEHVRSSDKHQFTLDIMAVHAASNMAKVPDILKRRRNDLAKIKRREKREREQAAIG